MKRIAPLSSALLCATLLGAQSAAANVRLAEIFSPHMVLQRDKPVPVWGWAEAGEEVKVSFAEQTLTTKADAEGKWSVQLQPLAVSREGRDLIVSGPNNTHTLTDVVVGDVWLGAGQSNMELGLGWCVKDDPEKLAATTNYPLVRHFRVRTAISPIERADISRGHNDGWHLPSQKHSREFSATLFYFGIELYEKLGIPVGLVAAGFGGSQIEPYISFEGVYAEPALKPLADRIRAEKLDPKTPEGKAHYEEWLQSISDWAQRMSRDLEAPHPTYEYPPAAFADKDEVGAKYHAMIAPITRFPVRGFLWYQGCNNSGTPNYADLTRALVRDWRRIWGEELPFYWVQLPNFGGSNNNPVGGDGWANIRQQQFQALDLPGTGMAVTIDVGDPGNLHPCNKYDIGKRLALWAFAKEYGFTDIVYSGPLYRGMTIEGSAIRLSFDCVGSGLMVGDKATNSLEPAFEVKDAPLSRFAIAGEDRVWHWANAKIEGDTVVVSSPEVPAPVAVRYAFSHHPEGPKLYNREGLPASPFRTDSW